MAQLRIYYTSIKQSPKVYLRQL